MTSKCYNQDNCFLLTPGPTTETLLNSGSPLKAQCPVGSHLKIRDLRKYIQFYVIIRVTNLTYPTPGWDFFSRPDGSSFHNLSSAISAPNPITPDQP